MQCYIKIQKNIKVKRKHVSGNPREINYKISSVQKIVEKMFKAYSHAPFTQGQKYIKYGISSKPETHGRKSMRVIQEYGSVSIISDYRKSHRKI